MSVVGTLAVRIKGDSSDLDKTLKSTTSSLAGFAKRAGAAAALATTAFVAFSKQTINTFDRISKLSVQAGITTESLSALGYAADLSGLSTEQLASNLGRLTKGMNDAAQGIGEAKKAFDVLGVDGGSVRTADEALLQIADKFQAMPDGAKKTALAMQLFGRSGMQMIPFLNQGRDGLDAMRKEAELFGRVISTKAGKAAEDLNDNISRLASVVQGFFFEAISDVLPTLNRFVESLVEGHKASLSFADSIELAFSNKSFQTLTDANEAIVKQTALVNKLKQANKEFSESGMQGVATNFTSSQEDIAREEKLLALMLKQADQMVKVREAALPPVYALPPELGNGDKKTDKVKEQLDAVKKLVEEYKRERDFQLEMMDSREQMLGMTENERTIQESINEVLEATSESLREIAEARLEAANLGASGTILEQFDKEAEKVKELATQYAQLAKVQTESSIAAQRQFSFGWETALNQYAENASNSAMTAGDMFAAVTNNMDAAIAKFVDTGKISFSDFASSVIKDLIRIQMQTQASKALSSIIGAIGGAIAGSFGSSGQVVGGGAGTMTIGESGFSRGGYTGQGGQFEAAGIVHKGEFVLSKAATQRHGLSKLDRMNKGYADGGYAGGAMSGSGVNINIKNEAGADGYQATAQAKRNTDGGLNIDVLVRRVVASDIQNNGALSQQMANTFGLRRNI